MKQPLCHIPFQTYFHNHSSVTLTSNKTEENYNFEILKLQDNTKHSPSRKQLKNSF